MVTTNKINWIKTLMKSLNIDVILPWELGLIVVLMSIVLIFFGVRQEKIKHDDFDNIPLTTGTTKIFFGSAFLIFGLIQLLPLLKEL